MSQITLQDSRPTKIIGPIDPDTGLLQCCIKSIDLHSTHNQMMVCPGCQQTIKCFKTEKDYNNYRIFCGSRNREIKTGRYLDKFVIIFYSYNT